ncbi:PilW family protein [Stenotrophomonas humi]|uniref:PilW family protein n=1 Tax=Stenotrophomonas humi TaxID=405444 RepID=UPI00070FCC31|nr:prepilin-type N-terminal cleavage/methylation domain-containing protein [Stenotrophomonas humi]
MNMHRHHRIVRARRHQAGQTLISMMVGVVISLITISAMLVLYKTMIEVSANASRSALRDGQVSAALLAAQMDLQSAGFGVPAADALSSKLGVRDSGKEVVWRYKAQLADAGFVCSGLRLVDNEGLYRFTPKACSDVAAANWAASERELLAGSAAFFTPAQKDGSAYASGEGEVGAMSLAPGYVFALKAERQCLPFMQQDFSTSPMALPGQQLVMQQADGGSHLFQACLPNLAVST